MRSSLKLHRYVMLVSDNYTINMERLAGLNFHGFQAQKFAMNIYLYITTNFIQWRCLSVLNVKYCESFPIKNFIGWNPQKSNPANISTFTVIAIV